jgi:hypothetical protein
VKFFEVCDIIEKLHHVSVDGDFLIIDNSLIHSDSEAFSILIQILQTADMRYVSLYTAFFSLFVPFFLHFFFQVNLSF